jgi:dGTPase
LLTRLEPKVLGAGLNLTRATLDATLKYPWFEGAKYGVYPEDAEAFAWIRQGAPDGRLCLEAQVMDWADDVAYSVHDLEDGIHAGLIKFKTLISERSEVSQTAADLYCDEPVPVAELDETLDVLLAMDAWPHVYDGTAPSLVALKNLTGELHGRLCVTVQEATLAAAGPGPLTRAPLTRYGADLVVPRQQRLECALLKAITARYVMTREGAARAQALERELLAELTSAVERGAPATLDPLLRASWHAAASDAERRRVVIDQVASLTDTSAIAWHHRLCAT